MQEFRTVKEQALDHLSVTEGDELDLTCNLTSSYQLEIVLESEAHTMLGSRFIKDYTQRMLRLTGGYQGRHRQDIVEIAKAKGGPGEDLRC